MRPGRGGAATFAGSVEHQGVPVVAGRRHVLVVFACDVEGDADDRAEVRAGQRRAAKTVFGARAHAEIEWRASAAAARRAAPPPAASGYRSLF